MQYENLVYLAGLEGPKEVHQEEALLVHRDVIAVCGSMGVLHALALNIRRPNYIRFIDVNSVQLAWSHGCIELIKKTKTLKDYFKRYYCRDFGDDLADLVRTDPDPDWQIDPALVGMHSLAVKLKRAKPVSIKPKFGSRAEPEISALDLQTTRPHGNLNDKGKLHVWGDETRNFKVYHTVPRHPGDPRPDGVEYIYNGWGFHSEEGYVRVRKILLETPIEFAERSILTMRLSKPSYVYLSSVWAMNEEVFVDWIKLHFDEIASDMLRISGSNMFVKYGTKKYPEGRIWVQYHTHYIPPIERGIQS